MVKIVAAGVLMRWLFGVVEATAEAVLEEVVCEDAGGKQKDDAARGGGRSKQWSTRNQNAKINWYF